MNPRIKKLLDELEDYPNCRNSQMEIIQDIRRLLRNNLGSVETDLDDRELEIKEALLYRSRIYFLRSKSISRRAKNTVDETERKRLFESAKKYLKISQDYFNAAMSYGDAESL